MNKLPICFMLIAISMEAFAQDSATGNLLNVPEPTAFNDPSALRVKSNLQSQQYQDFLHTLYRFDQDNLKRVDNLFANPDSVDRSSGISTNQADAQPSYNDYIQSQQQQQQQQQQFNNNFGISQDSSKSSYEDERYERSAQGAIFRPLFVYRIFQERTIEREEERLRRRLIANRRRLQQQKQQQSQRHQQNQFDY